MGMLDRLKKWFGGEQKAAPSRPSPQMRAPVARASPASKPATPQAAPEAPVATLTATEALDLIAAKAAANEKSAPAQIPSERREKPRINAREGTTVLVIDDSPTIVALLKRMLEQSGYNAIEASDAETGVSMALSEKPDLIFLDIVLPGMNGFEALRRLRRDPITKTTPIIMISGNELATEQFYAQRIGADDFMKKPFSRSEVFTRIEKLLDEHKVIRRHVVPSASTAATATIADTAATHAAQPVAAAPAVSPAAPVVTAPVVVAPDVTAPVVAAPDVAAPAAATTPMATAPVAVSPVLATPVVTAPATPVAAEAAIKPNVTPAPVASKPTTPATTHAPVVAATATSPAAVVNIVPPKPPTVASSQRPTTH